MKNKMYAFLVVLMFFISFTHFYFAAPPTEQKQEKQLAPQRQSQVPQERLSKESPSITLPITIQKLYRVTCTSSTVCSCAKPTDIVISGGGKCSDFIHESHPSSESAWYLNCGGISWRGGDLNTLQRSQDNLTSDRNPLWIITGYSPIEINIVCAEVGFGK